MATKLEEERWEQFKEKERKLFKEGLENKKFVLMIQS